MTAPVDTYSRKGFLYTLGFAAVVVAVSALVAFLSASEVVTCRRVSGARVDCTLARTLAGGVPVKTAILQNVLQLAVVESRERTGIGQPRRAAGPTYRLRFVAEGGDFLSVQTGFSELDSLRSRVEEMLRDRSTPRLDAVLPGSPRVHPWSIGFLVFGLALVPLWVLGYFFPALRPKQRSPRE